MADGAHLARLAGSPLRLWSFLARQDGRCVHCVLLQGSQVLLESASLSFVGLHGSSRKLQSPGRNQRGCKFCCSGVHVT